MSAGQDSDHSSHNSSRRSDLDEKIDSDAFEIEQESAKLQAEVQKLSKELEDLMSSRRISEGVLRREDFGNFETVGEEEQLEVSLEEEERETSRFPNPREDPAPMTQVEPLPLPSKRPTKQVPESRHREVSPPLKPESFGLMAPRASPPKTDKGKMVGEGKTGKTTGWKSVNEMLTAQGFRPLLLKGESGEVQDWDSVCETMQDVLADFSHCVQDLTKAEKTINSLTSDSQLLKDEVTRLKSRIDEEKSLRQEERFDFDRRSRDQERQASTLTVKLETALSQLKQRDELMRQLKEQQKELNEEDAGPVIEATDRDKAIFRQYFKREPKGGRDGKVLGMINAYEERKKRSSSPDAASKASAVLLKEMRSQIDAQTREIESLEKQKSQLMEEIQRLKSMTVSGKEKPSEVLVQALETLQLKNEKQLPLALHKMQQVIRALPGLESFIKAISAEVLTNSSDSVENVIPTIRTWKQKAVQWETWATQKMQLCHLLRIDSNADFGEIVRGRQLRAVKGVRNSAGLEHFRTLFEVGSEEDVVQVMNQVFLFVHEMKGLLQVRGS